ncbi:MAG: hypothetical protein L0L57_06945 [Alkalibacterium sp.]|nr:hypothetical protein [Alkalibacterium sp.]
MTLSKDEMIEEISQYMHGYLKEGKLSVLPFLSNVNPAIDSITDLLKIHFLLLEETQLFVKKLPQRLKRFKTTTVSKKELTHSSVRGRILWQETLDERHRAGNDRTIYVTSEQNRSYDTDENLVLKELLTVLYKLNEEELIKKLFSNMSWAEMWKALSPNVTLALYKNSYIQRVSTVKTTSKIRLRAAKHRMPIYREAATLLNTYNRLISGRYSPKELNALLYATFIMTDNEDTLMELYWTIQLIKERTTNSTFYLLTEGETKVAEWKDKGEIISVFHNSTGSNQLDFNIDIEELDHIDHPIITQMTAAKKWAEKTSKLVFGKAYSRGLWNGRPDILIEITDETTGKLTELLIGEVKNTNPVAYAKEGLWELSEYLHYVRDTNKEFINNKLEIKGILCVGDVPVKSLTLDNLEIKVLTEK